jgi:hypothetical protein
MILYDDNVVIIVGKEKGIIQDKYVGRTRYN